MKSPNSTILLAFLFFLFQSEGIALNNSPLSVPPDDAGEYHSTKINDNEMMSLNVFNLSNAFTTNLTRLVNEMTEAPSVDGISNQLLNRVSDMVHLASNDNFEDDYKISSDLIIRFKRDYDYDANVSNITSPEEDFYYEYIYPKSWTWVLIFCHFIVFVIGLVGNCLVCVAVYRNHSMRTVTNYFIVNLAVADFLVILFCLPPSVVWDVTSTWWFGTAMCKIVLYLQNVSVTVSILTLTFISIDRWYAICFPLKFKSTTGRAKTAIGIIWIFSMAYEIPEPIYLTAKPYTENSTLIYFTQCDPTWSEETDTVFMVVKMVVFYFLPLVFMSIAYIQIIRVLWKSGNVPHQAMDLSGGRNATGQVSTFAMNMNASTEGQLKSRRKAAKMLVAVVAMFAICFLPVHLLAVLRLTVKLTNSELNQAFALISHWLCYANSAVNPLIYNFMSGKFRREFKSSISKCWSEEQQSEAGTRSSGTYIYRFTTSRNSGPHKDEILSHNGLEKVIETPSKILPT